MCYTRQLNLSFLQKIPIGISPKIPFHRHMGQQEVYTFLEDHQNKWYNSREISARLSISIGAIAESLRKMRVNDEIEHRGKGRRGKGYQYKFRE